MTDLSAPAQGAAGSSAPVAPEDAGAMIDTARRLRDQVLAPAERQLDALPYGSDVRDDPMLSDGLAKAFEVGVGRIATPAESGGLGAGPAAAVQVATELAAGAPGFAAGLLGGDLLAAAITEHAVQGSANVRSEPGSGVAWTMVGGDRSMSLPDGLALQPWREPSVPAATITPQDDGVRLRNVRIRQVPSQPRGVLLTVAANAAAAAPATYLVDVTAPGVTATACERMGLRADPHVDLVVDDLFLGPEQMAFDAEQTGAFAAAALSAAATAMAAVAVGITRRAHEVALSFCRTRVQGGRPIVEHQNVAAILWRAEAELQIVHAALRATMVAAGDGLPTLRSALALRTLAAAVVDRVTIDMLELLGGYGVSTEYPTEKLYRDARVLIVGRGWIEGVGVRTPVGLA